MFLSNNTDLKLVLLIYNERTIVLRGKEVVFSYRSATLPCHWLLVARKTSLQFTYLQFCSKSLNYSNGVIDQLFKTVGVSKAESPRLSADAVMKNLSFFLSLNRTLRFRSSLALLVIWSHFSLATLNSFRKFLR